MHAPASPRSRFGRALAAGALVLLCLGAPASAAERMPAADAASVIAPYQDRFGRPRPVVAVIGENGGTELTDFVIPYAVLARSGVAQVVAVATRPGAMTMRPALRLQPEDTVASFDARFPEGADYVIVPAVVHRDDPALLAWVAAQGARGATVVSICDGALVVANTGLMKGRQATGHWATQELREQHYPDTHWVRNRRYVADGRIVSSAGISAAIPVSLALVEAIAGHRTAATVAASLGVTQWGALHDSEVFRPRFGANLRVFATTMLVNPWLHRTEQLGIEVAPGVDDLALALTADAYSRTGRSHAYSFAPSQDSLRTRDGLLLVPDRTTLVMPARVLAPLPTPTAPLFDQVLASIAARYGRTTARGVALDFEYPGVVR